MVETVEARSLSALNHLAANPPQYPNKPTDEKQEPLVLYISRVPGTRGTYCHVILSTAKPQLKNVTGEDVMNALYYIHLNLPNEAFEPPAPIEDPAAPRRSQDSSRSTRSQNQIRRKPLPADSRVAPHVSSPTGSTGPSSPTPAPAALAPSSAIPVAAPVSAQVASRLSGPVPVSALGVRDSPTPDSPPPPYSQSPIDRPLHSAENSDDDRMRPVLPPRPASSLDNYGYEFPPDLPPRPGSQGHLHPGSPSSMRPLGPRPLQGARPAGAVSFADSPGINSHSATRPPMGSSPPGARAVRGPSPAKPVDNFTPYVRFSLTIIRRDPSSGHQWNVGKVSSCQIETEEESGFIHQRPAYEDGPEPPPINISIETSGYCKFRGMPSAGRSSLDGRQRDSAASFPSSLRETSGLAAEANTNFSRQALMTYAKGWRTGIRETFRRGDGEGSNHGRFHSRERSSDSLEFENEGPITKPGPGLRAQGYMFTSPWDGRCIFRTGNAGRSVICRHIMPESGQSHSNPLVHTSSDRRKAKLGVYPPVSELRFNLPVADLLKSREEAAQQLHDHLNKLFKPQNSAGYSSDEEYSVLPFDLNLGKEKAGGGTRGRRAKLGKLIIFDEGMKMLDLVIAANMGIWWGAWEKSFWQ
ncbi:hypothetical protein jhhlp_001636 [Lomentospora prolificans]|uniref:Uncharacterized protein n=1 Tax=Lomentospora prolificans TaxID=41688 RepID=A0A2N3NIR8_9PEZI|nr:hypothetical protein jhhlp_001636 [Lomentospora prolificans]